MSLYITPADLVIGYNQSGSLILLVVRQHKLARQYGL